MGEHPGPEGPGGSHVSRAADFGARRRGDLQDGQLRRAWAPIAATLEPGKSLTPRSKERPANPLVKQRPANSVFPPLGSAVTERDCPKSCAACLFYRTGWRHA